MREIKFRGKITNGFVLGWGYYRDDNNKLYIVTDGVPSPQFMQVSSVDEYTGLKDKNGKEIYEGDILQYGVEEEYKGQIIFEEGAYQIKYSERRKHDFLHVNLQLFKIIGNIWENQDFLK